MSKEEKNQTNGQSEEKISKLQKSYLGMAFGFGALVFVWIAVIAFMLVPKKGKPAVSIPIANATLMPLYLLISDQPKK